MTALELADLDSFQDSRLFSALLEHLPAAVAVFDLEMRYIACNRPWIEGFKLNGIELVGRSHYEVVPGIAPERRELHRRALAGQSISSELDRITLPDGSVEWMRWKLAPWRDALGAVAGLLFSVEVLTSQIEREFRNRAVHEELSLFIDIADNFAVCMLDDDGNVSIWNSGAERLCGWSEVEVLGKPFAFMFDAGDRERGLPERQLEIARENGSFRDRTWRIHKDGRRMLADVTITRIDGDGQLPSGFGQVIRDVTREDTQARSLEASAVLLRSILETVPDALIVIDDHGLILSFSKAAEALFGYAPNEVIGRNLSMLMPSPDREQHDGYLARYRETGRPHIIGGNRRVLGLRKDGTVFPHTLRVGEAFGGGQRLFTGFLHDLTETEEAEARMDELQRELAHIARISEMGALATAIAHELNQPLMAIGNFVQTSAELIRSGEQAALQPVSRALDEAGRETLRAGAIVKRLRSFVSRGELDRTFENPGELAREACELAATGAKYRNVKCVVTAADDLPDILVDRIQIQQVLVNLVRNALEAIGSDGTVNVVVRPDGDWMRFTVSDTGPGVPPGRIARLFEPFSTTKDEGMGIGLVICRNIVEAHGGKLWYEGGLAGGAAFQFTLPKHSEENDDAG